jgi:hypothetical protein
MSTNKNRQDLWQMMNVRNHSWSAEEKENCALGALRKQCLISSEPPGYGPPMARWVAATFTVLALTLMLPGEAGAWRTEVTLQLSAAAHPCPTSNKGSSVSPGAVQAAQRDHVSLLSVPVGPPSKTVRGRQTHLVGASNRAGACSQEFEANGPADVAATHGKTPRRD